MRSVRTIEWKQAGYAFVTKEQSLPTLFHQRSVGPSQFRVRFEFDNKANTIPGYQRGLLSQTLNQFKYGSHYD